MINILPAVIEITTRQESPQPSAVPCLLLPAALAAEPAGGKSNS